MDSKKALQELGRFEISFLDEDNAITDQLIKETEEYKCIDQDLDRLQNLEKSINELYNLYEKEKREKNNIEICEQHPCQESHYNLGAFEILKNLKDLLYNGGNHE